MREAAKLFSPVCGVMQLGTQGRIERIFFLTRTGGLGLLTARCPSDVCGSQSYGNMLSGGVEEKEAECRRSLSIFTDRVWQRQ